MADVAAGFCVGVAEVAIGYPFRTVTTRMMNNIKYFPLPLRSYYQGAVWPLGSAIACNGIGFSVKERTLKYTNQNHFLSGGVAGLVVAPVLFGFDVAMFRRQTGQPVRWGMFRGMRGALAATSARESLALSLYFGTYHHLREQRGWSTFASGGMAGLANWSGTYWLETLRCRMICQRTDLRGAWRLGQLYVGFPVAAVRSVLVNSVSFSVFEYSRALFTRAARQ